MLSNQTIDKNAPNIEPLNDTWNYNSDLNAWAITFPFDLCLSDSVQKRNDWYAKKIIESLNAFSELARIRSVLFGPLRNNNDVERMNLKRQPEESYEEYFEKVCQSNTRLSCRFCLYDCDSRFICLCSDS